MFLNLPTEIQALVLSYLDSHEIVKTLFVSRYFHTFHPAQKLLTHRLKDATGHSWQWPAYTHLDQTLRKQNPDYFSCCPWHQSRTQTTYDQIAYPYFVLRSLCNTVVNVQTLMDFWKEASKENNCDEICPVFDHMIMANWNNCVRFS